MYVIDITRGGTDDDLMLGKDSMDAKRKTIDYIIDYVFANCCIYLDRDVLDQNLDMTGFSLKKFMKHYYQIKLNEDLKIVSFPTEKDKLLLIKVYNLKKTPFPYFHAFPSMCKILARDMNRFLINDYLILKYKDNLEEFEKRISTKNPKEINYFIDENFICGIIDLEKYKTLGIIDLLLNKDCTARDLMKDYERKLNL